MEPHIKKNRLLEIAERETGLAEPEIDHLEHCSECMAVYAQGILQVARARAREKRQNPKASRVEQ